MKQFKRNKTIQLSVMLVLILGLFYFIFSDAGIFHDIATNGNALRIFIVFWGLLLVSIIGLVYDFSVYTELKRKYGEMDMAMYSDPLTGLGNRSSLDAFIDSYKNRKLPEGIGAITIRLTGIGEINEKYGNAEGDRIIKTLSNILSTCAKNRAFVGRNGGNNFLALFRDATAETLQGFMTDVSSEVDKFNEHTKAAKLTFSYGIALHTAEDSLEVTELVAQSYKNSMN